jgi:hypothetical protein
MAYCLEQITTVHRYGLEWRMLPRVADHDLYSLRSVRHALGIKIAARDVLSSAKLVKEDTDYWTDQILFGKSSDGRKHKDTWVMWKGVMMIAFRLRPGHPACTQMAWQTSTQVLSDL